MKNILLKILLRTAELLIFTFVLSAIVTGLNVAELIRTRITTLVALVIGAIIFILLNIRFSRNCYFQLRNLPLYCMVSGGAFLLYSLILFCVYKIGGNIAFTWLFSIAKFASYINPNITTSYAVIFFEFILVLTMAISPLGMDFLLMYHGNQKEDN